jgi:hypothetical protein
VLGAATGLTIGLSVTAAPEFVLLQDAGLLVTAAIGLLLATHARSGRDDALLWLAMSLAVSIWPALTLPCVVAYAIDGWISRAGDCRPGMRTIARAAAPVVGVLAIAALTQYAADSLLGVPESLACIVPNAGGAFLSQVVSPLIGAGPYVCALAALGLFTHRRTLLSSMALPIVVLIAGTLTIDPRPPLHTWAITVFLAAGCGLVEATRACRDGVGGRLAAAMLIVLMPALVWQSSAVRVAGRVDAHLFGHDTLSLMSLSRVLATMPSNARLVSEDALSDVLVRAVSRTPPIVIPREPTVVSHALETGQPLYALPVAQHELEAIGYRLTDGDVSGVAEVTRGAECQAATGEWRSTKEWSASASISLVAQTPNEAGPVVVYVSLDKLPALKPIGWPAGTERGFYTTVYDLSLVDDRSHLSQDVRDDAVGGDVVDGRRFVARLELWRTPAAPSRLTVDFGAAPHLVQARVAPRAAVQRLLLCPTFRHAVQPFAR